ncbi:MAG: hypothetical protein NWE88_02710 [Candidatus Bathyarchaeota archaeon]|nr:hypothetical protein [Candidatus Bathyarchaeota archaeon]
MSELRDALDIDGLKRRAYHAYNEDGLCIDPLGVADVGLWGGDSPAFSAEISQDHGCGGRWLRTD